VSAENTADYYAKNISLGMNGVSYDLITEKYELPLYTPLGGSFALINTLVAVAVADVFGVSQEAIRGALEKIKNIDGRMERVSLPLSGITVMIDYAHTPDALEKLLLSVREMRTGKGRIVLLFGCGGDRDRGKRKEMAQIASRLADFIIVTSDNSRNEPAERIIRDILRGIDKEKEFVAIRDRREAIEYAVFNSHLGDIIILAGKGHERYEIDFNGKHPFDEREIVKEAYLKYKNGNN
jgi:UDP-N-acetylmuramoyl-L-alanyl-D-glutamate--2,6-diaminopimelate ligase